MANIHAASNLPPNCLYIVAEQNPDGTIASFSVEPHRDPYARRVRLIANDPAGGFSVFEGQTNSPPFHQMRLASETGYRRELVLGEESLLATPPSAESRVGHHIAFYFKSGGKYGKATVSALPHLADALKVRVGIRYVIQRDGSRNLETGDFIRRVEHRKR